MIPVKNTQPETKWQPDVANTRPDQADKSQPTISQIKPLRPLTRKQAAFVKHLIDNPKASATEAVRQAYNVTTESSAGSVAVENMQKPAIIMELAKHSGTAQMVMLEVLEQSRKEMYNDSREAVQWATNARQTADSLLDRVHGKATQKVESTSTVVTLSIDLTGAVPKIN